MSLANNILGYIYLIISIEVESENYQPSKYWYLIFEILVTSGQKLVIFQRSTTPSWIYSSKWTPSRHLLFQSQQWKHKNNMYSFSNLTINIKERRQKASMASLWGLYFQLWTDSINSRGVSIVGFEQVNNGCDYPFFFVWVFFHKTFTIHRKAGEMRDHFNFSLPFLPS